MKVMQAIKENGMNQAQPGYPMNIQNQIQLALQNQMSQAQRPASDLPSPFMNPFNINGLAPSYGSIGAAMQTIAPNIIPQASLTTISSNYLQMAEEFRDRVQTDESGETRISPPNKRKRKENPNSAGPGVMHKCSNCDRMYASHGNLRRHKRYECQKEPSFRCPVCDTKFQHRHSAKIHYNSTHKDHEAAHGNWFDQDAAKRAISRKQSSKINKSKVTKIMKSDYDVNVEVANAEPDSGNSTEIGRVESMNRAPIDLQQVVLQQTSMQPLHQPMATATAELSLTPMSVLSQHTDFLAIQQQRAIIHAETMDLTRSSIKIEEPVGRGSS